MYYSLAYRYLDLEEAGERKKRLFLVVYYFQRASVHWFIYIIFFYFDMCHISFILVIIHWSSVFTVSMHSLFFHVFMSLEAFDIRFLTVAGSLARSLGNWI